MAFSQISISAKQDARQDKDEDFKRREQAGTSPLRDIWGGPPGRSPAQIFAAGNFPCIQAAAACCSCFPISRAVFLLLAAERGGGEEAGTGEKSRIWRHN